MSRSGFTGEALRDAREQRDLTVQQISDAMHVPAEYIRALEAGELDALPGLTYALGFLNTYCNLLDLDPHPLRDQLRAWYAVDPPRFRASTAAPAAEAADRHPLVQNLLTWGTICAVVILAWFSYSLVVRPWIENAESRVEAGAIEAPQPPVIDLDF
jgi:cytoskeleton protein RodZ